jgi:hypothetical protein
LNEKLSHEAKRVSFGVSCKSRAVHIDPHFPPRLDPRKNFLCKELSFVQAHGAYGFAWGKRERGDTLF